MFPQLSSRMRIVFPPLRSVHNGKFAGRFDSLLVYAERPGLYITKGQFVHTHEAIV